MRMIDIEALLKAAELAGKEYVSIDLLKDFEQVDAVPVVRGEWEPTDMGGGEPDEAYVCSVCGEPWVLIDGTPAENNMNYCPACGAKMSRGADNGTA